MTDTLIVQRGEALKAQIDYTNEDGTALNLTGYELSCPEASHDTLLEGVELTYIDQTKGTAEIYVPPEVMDLLPFGRSSWLRLAFTLEPGADPTISQKLWVEIQ